MRVSISWLKELFNINATSKELTQQLNSKIQGGVKEVTDDYIELDLKGYNRADLLSIRGVALETAAITNSQVNFQEIQEAHFPWVTQEIPPTPVKVEAEENCPVYCIAKIEGLKVATSSADWVKKLADSGMRSINNVADVTNLVMLEYGQPTHAFDADKVTDKTLIVRMANTGEELVTLDNKKRVLEPTDMVIADPEKAVGLAGVMGGKDSEVSDTTTTILLEAAIFNPGTIRKTASRLNLPSEASKRFQHGLTKTRLLQALDGAIKMYQSLGGKLTALTIIDNLQEQSKQIEVSFEKLQSLIGIDVKPEFVEESLKKLHFQVSHLPGAANTSGVGPDSPEVGQKGWKVTPPYWRLDVEIEADVIEEVARMYGYENISAKELLGELPQKIDQSLFEFIKQLKLNLVAQGLDELQTYSFYSTKVMEAIDIYKEGLIKIANPMSKETEYLRNLLWPNLVEKTAENLKNLPQVETFEVGKVYQIVENAPYEAYHLAVNFCDGSSNPLAALWQIVHKSLAETGVRLDVKDDSPENLAKHISHPTRYTGLTLQDREVGYMAEAHPRIVNKFGTEKRVAILEIDFTKLLSHQ